MKSKLKPLLIIVSLFCLTTIGWTQSQENSAKLIFESIQQRNSEEFTKLDLFIKTDPSLEERKLPYLDKVKLFKINATTQSQLLKEKPEAITMTLPTSNGVLLKLKLLRNESFSGGIKINTSSGKNLSLAIGEELGVHYIGSIDNEANSVVTLNVFPDRAFSYITNRTGNYALQTVNKEASANPTYMLSRADDFNLKFDHICNSIDPHENSRLPNSNDLSSINSSSSNVCIRNYIETDYAMFLELNSSIGDVKEVTLWRYAAVQAIYANIGIPLNISELYIWDTPDPYNGSITAFANLSLFDGISANLASLYTAIGYTVGAPLNGSQAVLDVLCGSDFGPFGVMNMVYGFEESSECPGAYFNHSVFIISHEIGHNIGSPHTHWCGWQGGPIDGCAQGEFIYPTIPVGFCLTPCPPTVNDAKGTIMSYCSIPFGASSSEPCLDPQGGGYPNPGIDINLGFASQVSALLISKYNTFETTCATVLCNSPFIIPPVNERSNEVNRTAIADKQKQHKLFVYPNPAQGLTTVEFSLDQTTQISLHLYNSHGKIIHTFITKAIKSKGVHQVEFDVSHLSPGLYYFELKDPEGIVLEKIIIN